MKTIKQQAEVSFKLLDFADKVVMLPIMNMLADSVKNSENIEITIIPDNTWYMEPEYAEKALKVLSNLGCRTSLGENYEDIVKSNNSQEEKENKENKEKQNNRCILQLFEPGTCKLEIVKTIKDELHIGLEEAKDLVDSWPVDIDLSQYKIEQSEYEYLFSLLKRKGCTCNLTTKEQ